MYRRMCAELRMHARRTDPTDPTDVIRLVLDSTRSDSTRLDSIYDRHMPVVVTTLHRQTDHRRSIADHVASLI
jgi:hypothetical protein